jgi:hypothetical protein
VQPEQPPLTHAVVQASHLPPPAPHVSICDPGLQSSPAQQPEQEVVVQVQCPPTQAWPCPHAVVQLPQCCPSVIGLMQVSPHCMRPGKH